MILCTIAEPGNPARAELDAVRLKIAELRAAIEDARDAPLALADAVERVLSQLRLRASSEENRLTALAQPDGVLASSPGTPLTPLDVIALVYNLAPDFIEKGLRTHLKPACGNGLSPAARGARIAELRSKLEPLLDQEETLFVDLLGRDIIVERDVPETAEDIRRLLRALNRDAA